MNFTLRITNPPAGAAWWIATWFLPSVGQWDTGWQPISTTYYTFSDVNPGLGDVYVDAYDQNYNRLTDGATRGRVSPQDGSTWEYNFATGVLAEVGVAPPGQPKAGIATVSIWPPEALQGETVAVAVVLGNGGDVGGFLAPVAVANGVVFPLTPDYIWVEPGAQAGFAGSFIMPNTDVVVEILAYHWDGGQWIFDNISTSSVKLKAVLPSPEFRDLSSTFSMEANFA